MLNLWTKGTKYTQPHHHDFQYLHSKHPMSFANRISSRQHLCILRSIDNLSIYTAVDPFIMMPSGNKDTVTFTETRFAQVRMYKAISGTMGGGRG
jgi:hypothetical protein